MSHRGLFQNVSVSGAFQCFFAAFLAFFEGFFNCAAAPAECLQELLRVDLLRAQ